MASLNPAPSYERVLQFATPKIDDLIFYELKDISLPSYKEPPEYGEPHPNDTSYPNHVLVFVSPAGEKSPKWARWYYAAARENQDDYNYEISGRRLFRTYVVPRTDYEDGTFVAPTKGDADGSFAAYTYASQDVKRIGQRELDSWFVVIRQTFIDQTEEESLAESGTARGETMRKTTVGDSATANNSAEGIITSRQSRYSDEEELWFNTEQRLNPRAGVNKTRVSHRPGYKTTSTSEVLEVEPAEDSDDVSFSSDLITVDVEGEDALWGASREKIADDPASGGATTSRFGGGLISDAYSKVADSATPDSGVLILDSKVQPLGRGEAVKHTRTIDALPALVSEVRDEQTNTLIEITKTVVDAATATPSIAAGDVTEVQAIDKWRSLQVRTRYKDMLTVEGYEETYPIIDSYRYPPKLTGARFLYARAEASSGTDFSFAEDLALVFDVTESYSTAVTGEVIRIITSDPETTAAAYSASLTTSLFSTTVGFVSAWAWAGTAGTKASATVRTWQTPMAVVEDPVLIEGPDYLTASLTIDREFTNIIPSGGVYPSGTTTVDIQTSRGKLGMYVVTVKQLDL